MSKIIINEGYSKNPELFKSAKGSIILYKNKNYIDLSMCAGSILLGHNHEIVKKVINKFLKEKVSNVAAPNIHAENFAKNIKRIVPNSEKIIFCNSGTEGVIKSLRISRAINNKLKIAYVTGGWHGSVDQLLFKTGKSLKPIELSGGLLDSHKKNLVLIPYNEIEKTKKILERYKKKLNCIIVEPVQASLPYENIKNYLSYLEVFCKKNNCNLIFDEMITGLRTDCSSVQKYFKIKPDISIFGKCFGAGFPIGIITINKKVSKKLIKVKPKVFFGGTFSGNSIITFIGNEVLKYVTKNRKKIFYKLNMNAKYFEEELNKFFTKSKLDLKVYRFKSMLRLVYSKKFMLDRASRDFFETRKNKKISKFKKYIQSQNINMPANGIMFISLAHEKSQINYLVKKFKIGAIKFFKKS